MRMQQLQHSVIGGLKRLGELSGLVSTPLQRAITMAASTANPKGPYSQHNPVGLYDCHAHMTASTFDEDRSEVLAAASSLGVAGIIVVSESTHDADAVLELAKQHRGLIYPCLGLHPVNAQKGGSADEAELRPMLGLIEQHAEKLIAVGEVGLDFTPAVVGKDDDAAAAAKASQRAIFTAQVELAKRLGLPLNVHSRGAGHHAIKLMVDAGHTHALLHAFDGKARYALAAAQQGFLFSVPASIARDPQTQKLVKALPITALVLESDSPALPAEKQARNTPAAILTSLRMIAEIKGMTEQQAAAAVTANTFKLFPKLLSLQAGNSRV